jgi:hypothetical protein
MRICDCKADLAPEAGLILDSWVVAEAKTCKD